MLNAAAVSSVVERCVDDDEARACWKAAKAIGPLHMPLSETKAIFNAVCERSCCGGEGENLLRKTGLTTTDDTSMDCRSGWVELFSILVHCTQ